MTSTGTDLRYVVLDVFCDRPFAGNPLAVVWDADELDDATMLAIAREFGFSETVFLQASDDARCDVRTRIFTPGVELPFAGHPTIGTAAALGRETGATGLVFDQLAGALTVAVDGDLASFVLDRPIEIGPVDEVSVERMAVVLGVDPSDVVAGGRTVSAGVPFLMVEVASLDALARCAPVEAPTPDGLYVVCRVDEHGWRARMFAPHLGIAEDPATGSAATAFAGLLALAEPDGEVSWRIDQGVELGRPSRIDVTADVSAGRPRWVRVAGRSVVVAEGTLHV
jgi:trans-2,3-dihydro-3-hydroxyanthranilate isomerase